MSYECMDWEAWYDRMPRPGERGPTLHITGKCECSTAGYSFSIDVGNQGTPPNAEVLRMELKVEEPEAAADVLTIETINWQGQPGDTYKQVEIYGAASATVPIRDVS